jgi:hypothetical protein
MGWTYFQATARKRSLDILRDELNSLEFIDAEQIGRTIYAAVKYPRTTSARFDVFTEPERVFGLVVLISRRNGQFGYKDMGEEMGPYESACPARILDKLTTPAPNEYARQWRERCRANIQAAARAARADFECTGTFDGFACGSDADPGL